MHEVLSLHIGQAGVRLGCTAWELYCLEHDLQPDGVLTKDDEQTANNDQGNFTSKFFSVSQHGKHTPRALFLDLEASAIDEVATGSYRDLFDPQCFLSTNHGSGHNYARAQQIGQANLVGMFDERLRVIIEECGSLQGFIITHAMAGGAGSGLTDALLQHLSDEYGRNVKLAYSIFPSPETSTSVLEPYNGVLAMNKLMNLCDVTMVMDNAGVSDLCRDALRLEKPTFTDLNRLMAHVMSTHTSAIRFDGCLNASLHEFIINLVPFPRLHFLLSSFAPLMKPSPETMTTRGEVVAITEACFLPSNTLARCTMANGKFMACSLLYQGDMVPKWVGSAVANIKTKRTISFVDWMPTGFKCGISYQPPTYFTDDPLEPNPRCVSMMSNSTAVSEVFESLTRSFDLMYAHRASVHTILDAGLELSDLEDAREDLADLERDYIDVAEEVDLDDDDEVY